MASPETFPNSPIAFAPKPSLVYNLPKSGHEWLSGINKMSKERASQLEYPDELKLREVLSQGVPLLIPRKLLFGRQEDESYDRRKRKAVEDVLKNEGIGFLLRNPIIVCALPDPDKKKMTLVIVDGHHRSRYSGHSRINEIPSLVYTPEQIAEAFNIKNKTELTPEELAQQLFSEAINAMGSFRTLPDSKRPEVVTGFASVDKLPFKRFQIAA